MIRKPWSIFVLAMAQIFTPIFNVFLGAIMFKLSPITFGLNVIRHSSTFGILDFFFLGPISGLAIFCVRWWSYPIFLLAVGRVMIANFLEWRAHPELIGLPVLLGCYGLNLVLVTYFLIPRIREVYFNPRIRWWESKPRYSLMVEATVSIKGKNKKCVLENISEGGALIEADFQLSPLTPVRLHFSCFDQEFNISGEVVYNRKPAAGHSRKKTLHGLQFVFTPQTKMQVKKCVQAFELLGLERKPARESSFASFVTWLKTPFLYLRSKRRTA